MAGKTTLKELSDRELLENLYEKVNILDEKLDICLQRINKVEKRVEHIENNMTDLENGLAFMESEYEQHKQEIRNMQGNLREIEPMKNRIIEIENASRRNNLILVNIPEKVEEHDCTNYVSNFIKTDIGVDAEIDTAYRIPSRNTSKPRMILVQCNKLQDRDKILKEAPTALRGKRFNGNTVYVNDDVVQETRKVDYHMRQKAKTLQNQGYTTSIPWSTPRVIRYRERDNPNSRWKTMRASDVIPKDE